MKDYKFKLTSPKKPIDTTDITDHVAINKIDQRIRKNHSIYGLTFVNEAPMMVTVHAKKELSKKEQKAIEKIVHSYDHKEHKRKERSLRKAQGYKVDSKQKK